MRERPIIFSGAMVRAILEGRKTQTRRVVKPQPIVESDGRMHWNGIGWTTHHDRLTGPSGTMLAKCPFGRPGDRLWVREAFLYDGFNQDGEVCITYKNGQWASKTPNEDQLDPDQYERLWVEWSDAMTAAGYVDEGGGFEWPHDDRQPPEINLRWRSPIHMPRWASRLTLEVTGVRVERLQDITPEDARAEGHPHVPGTERYSQAVHDDAARDWFMDLWDDINAERGHPWESNPWVWVVMFRRLEEARS